MSITGKLEVTVHEGKQLEGEDFGKMDPYTKIEVKKQAFKTKVHKKGGNAPKWDQAFTFNLTGVEEKEAIHFQVFDEDLISDDKVGRADLPLSVLAIFTDQKDGHWIQLVDFDNFRKIAGYLRISVKFEGEGWPYKKEAPPPKPTEPIKPEEPKPVETKKEEVKAEHHQYVPPPKPYVIPETPTVTVTVKPVEPTYVHTAPTGHELKAGERLHRGDKLTSKNKRFTATLVDDGNFVVFDGRRPLWASKTADYGGVALVLQEDGNLILFNASHHAIWASNFVSTGTPVLTLHDDGNLNIVVNGTSIWATNTAQKEEEKKEEKKEEHSTHGKEFKGGDTLHAGQELKIGEKLISKNTVFKATLQKNGDFVVSLRAAPLWATGTAGKGGVRIVLQDDKNLVLYTETDKAKWATRTNTKGHGKPELKLHDDGELTLTADGERIWSGGYKHPVPQGIDSVTAGYGLSPNEKLKSLNRKFELHVEKASGDIVLYSMKPEKKKLWHTQTKVPASRLHVDNNGQLQVVSPKNEVIWVKNKAKKGHGPVRLVLQNDGELRLFNEIPDLFTSKTGGHPE